MRPLFNQQARQTILSKLDQILDQHPGLNWTTIAKEVGELGSRTFDRKYFQRLREGTLSDANTELIVRWIVKYHEPGLRTELTQARDRGVEIPISGIGKPGDYVWQRPSLTKSAEIQAAFMHNTCGIYGNSSDTIEYSYVSFLQDGRIWRISGGEFGSPQIHALTFSSDFILLDRSETTERFLSKIDVDINPATIIEFVIFWLRFLDQSTDGLIFLTSTFDIPNAVDFFYNDNSAYQEILRTFSPPKVTQLDGSGVFLVEMDVFTESQIRRYHLQVGPRCSLRIIGQKRKEFVARDGEAPLHKSTMESNVLNSLRVVQNSDAIFQKVHMILFESFTWWTFKKFREIYNIEIIFLYGVELSCFHSERAGVIFSIIPPNFSDYERLALSLVMSLRVAKTRLLKLHGNTALMPVPEAAARLHAMTVDSMAFACKCVDEIREPAVRNSLIKALKSLRMLPFFDAYTRGASNVELLDVYSML